MTRWPEHALPEWLTPAFARWWAVVFAGWTLFAMLMVSHARARYQVSVPILEQIAAVVPFYWAWIPLMPAIVGVATRFDFTRDRRLISLGVHAAAALAVAVAQTFLYAQYRWLVPLDEPGSWAAVVMRSFGRHAVGDLTTYALMVTVIVAVRAIRLARQRDREAVRAELHASRLEAQLSAARLDVLRMQLSPHFLFNALNSVSVLVLKQSNEAAIRAIGQLGNLLRGALQAETTPVRPLDAELAFVGGYLQLEQLRFGERLVADISVEPAAGAALVPTLILQPLVENAIVHGLAPAGHAGRVRIAAARCGGILRIDVSDSGVGLRLKEGNPSQGIGLVNSRARLHELHGERARLTLVSLPEGGCLASIELPFVTEQTAGRTTELA